MAGYETMSRGFLHQLRECGLTKGELASLLGVHPYTIYRWRDSPPRYATAYVELLKKHEEHKRKCPVQSA